MGSGEHVAKQPLKSGKCRQRRLVRQHIIYTDFAAAAVSFLGLRQLFRAFTNEYLHQSRPFSVIMKPSCIIIFFQFYIQKDAFMSPSLEIKNSKACLLLTLSLQPLRAGMCLDLQVQTGAKKSQKSRNTNIFSFQASKIRKYYI